MIDLKKFIEERPSINIASFAREIGCSRQMIDYILRDQERPGKKLIARMTPIMIKYGYKQE